MKTLLTDKIRKTTEAAREIGVPVYNLLNWVRYGVIEPPSKDSSGHWLWRDADVARAREVWEQRRPGRREKAEAAA